MKIFLTLLLLIQLGIAKSTTQVIENQLSQFSFELQLDPRTQDELKPKPFLIGLPEASYPNVTVQYLNPIDCPFDCSSLEPTPEFWAQQQKVQHLETATLVINPVSENNRYFSRIRVNITFTPGENEYVIPNQNQTLLLSPQILNWETAKNWIQKRQNKRYKSISYPDGNWISFNIDQDGMRKISYNEIYSIFDQLSDKDPRSFMLFTNPNLGRAKSQATNQPISDNLVEISMSISGEGDGTFDTGDYLYFYAHGPSGFNVQNGNVTYHQNLYFTQNTYYLLIPNDNALRGERVQNGDYPDNVTVSLDYGISYFHEELDLVNPAQSGLGWASSPITHGGTYTLDISLNNPEPTVDAHVAMGFLGSELTETAYHNTNHRMICYFGSIIQGNHDAYASWSSIGTHVAQFSLTGSELTNGSNLFYAVNASGNSNSQPYFDYLNLYYGRQLTASSSYDFYSPIRGTQVRFNFDGSNPNTHVWDISNGSSPTSMALSENGNIMFFETHTLNGSPNHFIVFQPEEIISVQELTFENWISFSQLRSSQYQANHIIIGPESFRQPAQPLLDIRESTIYSSLEDIYREFSGGNKDPMAIRAFIQWTQEHWQSPTPYTFFLIGDADYDYRNITGESGNIVPTIEVGTSFSWATDDRLATLYGSIPDVALGRFPARNESELSNYIEKVVQIETDPELGPWRQRVTLIADDGARPEKDTWEIGTGKSHTRNSEDLASLIPPTIEVKKLYMLEYPEESDASVYGVVKPEATQAVLEALQEGTAIINYIGHGSPTQLAQERLLYLDRGDIQLMETNQKYPLWIVGTCSFGHFDDIHIESFSEELVREPLNAAAAVISTTRKITVSGNASYSEDLFSTIFQDGSVSNLPIGSILRNIKTGYGEGEYFTLFGDPAMRLPIPKDTLTISSIHPDTIKTLEQSSFTGDQNIISQSGIGIVNIRDAKRTVTREYNIASTTQSLSYTLSGPLLFRGQFSFTGSSFESDFRVPLDISYSNENAEMNLYIYEDDGRGEAVGNKGDIPLIGGEYSSDTHGPIISFETADGRIINTGDHIEENTSITIRLSDAIGINLTNEIGHEITLFDEDNQISHNLTNDFIYDLNSITTGTIEYAPSLESTEIHFTVKAWDSANNSSESSLSLNITRIQSLGLFNIFNYPNPFSQETQFTFEINQTAEISLDIFTLSGRKIMEITPTVYTQGYHIIDWDGNDAFGGQIANGVYLFRIQASANDEKVSSIGRIAKFR